MRPKKPDFLIQYEEFIQNGPPQCCHKCDNYGDDGHCKEFDMRPPDEFVNSHGQCNRFVEVIPF